jgi:regulator of extracellular matrix RemA (YlzA/DUF370 family)
VPRYIVFGKIQQLSADSLSLKSRINSDPINVIGTVGQRSRAVTYIASDSIIHRRVSPISTVKRFTEKRVQQLIGNFYFFCREIICPLQDVQDRVVIFPNGRSDNYSTLFFS